MQLLYHAILLLNLLGLLYHLLSGLESILLHPLVLPLEFLAGLLPEFDIALHLDLDLLQLRPPRRVLPEHVLHLLHLLVFEGELLL